MSHTQEGIPPANQASLQSNPDVPTGSKRLTRRAAADEDQLTRRGVEEGGRPSGDSARGGIEQGSRSSIGTASRDVEEGGRSVGRALVVAPPGEQPERLAVDSL